MSRSLTVSAETFRLVRDFRISRGARSEARVVLATIAEDGVKGRGECTPYPRYGESIDGTIEEIERVRAAIEGGAGRDALQSLLPPGAARNALDCALWDLDAKLGGTTAAALAGMPPMGRTISGITIGIDRPAAMAAEAATLARVPLLKIKVDADDPLGRVRAVRAAAPGPRLIVDPNESWSIEQLGNLQDALIELRVDLLEQPVPAHSSEALKSFARRVPICADEAVHTSADVAALVGAYDYVNIKLDKAGGLTEALRLAGAARAARLGVMVGCMLSSSLAIVPAMLVAQTAAFTDLDGPYLFAADRAGGIGFDEGAIVPPAPGFWGD